MAENPDREIGPPREHPGRLLFRKKLLVFGSVIAALFLYALLRLWFLWVILAVVTGLWLVFGHALRAILDNL
jgi:hypothetical protein